MGNVEEKNKRKEKIYMRAAKIQIPIYTNQTIDIL